MPADPPIRILVVDDEVLVANAISRFLRVRHYEVRVVTDPRTALDEVRAYAPDVVISDMNMPFVSGETVLRQVRDEHPSVARLLVSATVDKCDPAVYDLALVKPWRPEELDAAIHQALRAHRP